MKSRTEQILTVMNILVWVAFIALMIKGGIILFSYVMTVFNPNAANNFYAELNLSALQQFSFWHYTILVAFLIAVPLLQSYIAYLVIKVLGKVKLANPFTFDVSTLMEKISQVILATWIVVLVYDLYITWLMKKVAGLQLAYISGEFIFLAGVVFVIAQIFKKGVEIQSENELTV